MEENMEKLILDLLKDHNVLTIATLRPDGWPQATAVSYANDGLTLYVATGADAQKVDNIRQCDKVSLTVTRDYDDWNRIRGLSMGAVAEVIGKGSERKRAIDILNRKFPQLGEMGEADRYRGWVFLKITPKIVSVIDYTKGFGHTSLVKL